MQTQSLKNAARSFLFVSLVLILDVPGAISPGLAEEPATSSAPWSVFQANGDIRVRSGRDASGAWQQLGANDRIFAPSEIRTGDDGRLTITRGGDIIHILPGSRISLPAEGHGTTATEIIQSFGEAFFGVDKRPARTFKVTTPFLVTVVKGTAFGINVSETDASVSVSEGTVGVSAKASGKSADVNAGQTASVSSKAASDVSVSSAAAAAPAGAAPAAPASTSAPDAMSGSATEVGPDASNSGKKGLGVAAGAPDATGRSVGSKASRSTSSGTGSGKAVGAAGSGSSAGGGASNGGAGSGAGGGGSAGGSDASGGAGGGADGAGAGGASDGGGKSGHGKGDNGKKGKRANRGGPMNQPPLDTPTGTAIAAAMIRPG